MAAEQSALARVNAVLRRMRIPFFVGGSLASSVHGRWRATADIDLVAAFPPDLVERFIAELGPDFTADRDLLLDALARGRSFNVIYLPEVLKIDIFPLGPDDYSLEQMRRCRDIELDLGESGRTAVPVASPEDALLAKLRWFWLGGGVSERQWSDIGGIVEVQGDALDIAYLRQWAAKLDLSDLLERALARQNPANSR